MATPTTPQKPDRAAVTHALLVAAASGTTLLLVEVLNWDHKNLAVWTTFMVLAQYTFTAFQKGVERVLGRGLGLLCGLLVLHFGINAPLLALVLKIFFLLIFFTCHFNGFLNYTFLNAGLYLAVIVEFGLAHPEQAPALAEVLFWNVLVGVLVAETFVWLSGKEKDLTLRTGMWPSGETSTVATGHSLMLVATVLLTQFLTNFAALPSSAALVSVMVLTITPDFQSMLIKGKLRIVGLFLALLWSSVSLLFLSQIPQFPLFGLFLCLGLFLAAYLAITGGASSYAGLQMGLVLPMILVSDPGEFGSFAPAIQRFEGILIALASSLVVGWFWSLVGLGFKGNTKAI